MNLIIDVGNTLVKFGVYRNFELINKTSFLVSDFEKEIEIIKKDFPTIKKTIVSSVGRLTKAKLETLTEHFEVLSLDSKTKLPFKNLYKTPATLGVDRIALVSASVYHHSNKNVLIIDAGTCITYDFISDENEYFGGAISPGIRLRYRSLNNLTANLPLLETELPRNITGNTTESSIHSGVVYGILKEIEGVIDEYEKKYPDLTVILTGGDANFLSKQLKNGIFAHSNFLLDGLNFILDFNSK